MENLLVRLTDGGIKEIYSDSESYRGCETCDYGSEYINEFTIELTKSDLVFKVVNMYEHALTEDYMMKLFLGNIENIKKFTEQELYVWLEVKLKEEYENRVDEFKFYQEVH